MTSLRDTTQGQDTTTSTPCAERSSAPTDLRRESLDRHPTALGRHLDTYLAAVARELQTRGVLTGAPQRTRPATRLIGSIVLDTTALRLAAWTPAAQHPPERQSLGGALHPRWPAPVVVTWDEHLGWSVGLHHDPTRSGRRYLHPDLLPAAADVADFVVGLALGRPLGAAHPITPPSSRSGRPQLRLVP